MWHRKSTWLILIAALLTAAGGSYYWVTVLRPAGAAAQEPPIQTSVVRRGSILLAATGAGTVIPSTRVELSFASSGLLSELLVAVGDEVEAGAVLARLDPATAQLAVAQAELQVAQAAGALAPAIVAQNIALAELDVTAAEISHDAAQAALDELLGWEADPDAIALAEANLAAAEANLQSAVSRDAASYNGVTTAEIGLRQAEESLDRAQEEYDSAFDPARDWERNIDNTRSAAESNLTRAQDNLTIAQANLSSAWSNVSNASSVSARSSVLAAEQALAAVQTPPADAAISAARRSLQEAQLALERAQIRLAEARDSTTAELALAQAELNLQAARQQLAQTELVAPAAGTVMSIAAGVGERVGSTALITLADLGQPMLEVFLDESDLGQVAVGNDVEVSLDALPDQTFTGRVVQVDPQLQVLNGVATVRAVVQLNGDGFGVRRLLPAGLNATVDVVGGRAEQVLVVPIEALRELAPGQFAVFVQGTEGALSLRPVEVGLRDFTWAEIRAGLEQGEVVTTGIVQTGAAP